MKCTGVRIATARIKGLNKPSYYLKARCYYVWDIMFSDTSTLLFYNLPFIKMGDTKEEGEAFCNKVKENFKKAGIHDGDRVAVIFADNGFVKAIGCIGRDSWIDTNDKFAKKTFKELNITINSLKVY